MKRLSLSQRECSERLDLPYKWVRRLCHNGLDRLDRRTEAKLRKLAHFIGIDIEDLWREQEQSNRSNAKFIRWVGGKSKQAQEIVSTFPRKIGVYYEPFIGSGSVLSCLLESDIRIGKIECSDVCRPLIGIWKLVKRDPLKLAAKYETLYKRLEKNGTKVYFDIRTEFNETGDPIRFYFLMRTCRLAQVRFNQRGEMNTGFNYGRMPLSPADVFRLASEWHEKLNSRDVLFKARDYSNVQVKKRDFIYLDPPYSVGHSYYGQFDHQRFFRWLIKQRGRFALSYNGKLDDQDRAGDIPTDLFAKTRLIDNGPCSTMRLNGQGEHQMFDSLHFNY